MALTSINDVQDQVQDIWSPMFMKELRESQLLAGLVNKDYQGEIRQLNDTVKVSQINAPAGDLLTVGTDADSFSTEALSTTQVEVKADKRAVAAYEFSDLVALQSQIGAQESELRMSLMHAINKQINDYLYSLVAPSAAAPDHIIDSVADFNSAVLSARRKEAAKAKWGKEKGWWLLADPSYYSDMLDDTTLASADFGAQDAPVIGGQMSRQRFGFNILEDNSDGILQLSPASAGEDCALAFHPDFMLLVMQTEPTFKISDQHSQKKFGYVMSVDVVFGAKLGIDGDLKHIQIYNT